MNQTNTEALRNMVSRLHRISKNYDNNLTNAKKLHARYTEVKFAMPASFEMLQA